MVNYYSAAHIKVTYFCNIEKTLLISKFIFDVTAVAVIYHVILRDVDRRLSVATCWPAASHDVQKLLKLRSLRFKYTQGGYSDLRVQYNNALRLLLGLPCVRIVRGGAHG